MKIISNAYITQDGVYNSAGGLVEGTQRISSNHLLPYWQQGNLDQKLALPLDELSKRLDIDTIEEAVYVGRIPMHLGHFLIEGLGRLSDVVGLSLPVVGYFTLGILPQGILPIPSGSFQWLISAILDGSDGIFVTEHKVQYVKTLLIPEQPIILSQSCAEPWRLTPLISKIVEYARKANPDVQHIDRLHLKRYNEPDDFFYQPNSPLDPIHRQIARVSHADYLYGTAGSNTHLSIFGKQNARTEWLPRGNYQETMRNQLICDLVKTYNTH